jgi:sulfofructose kinase
VAQRTVPMTTSFDILGLGCVAVDDLLYVASYPPPDGKVQVHRHERQCGGLTATALVAAARLGARCAYAGVLGEDDLSQFVLERLRQEGVDVAHVRARPGARPIHSVIVVDEAKQTRNIFYNLEGVFGAEPGWPDESMIRSCRLLYVDHFGVEGMSWAARIARDNGIPVVADFERCDVPGFSDLLVLVDHLIVSADFAREVTGESQPDQEALKLWKGVARPEHGCEGRGGTPNVAHPSPPRSERATPPGGRVTVVTCGAEGCWYVGAADPSRAVHQGAFAVAAIDTTGCGDVFHGAYAAALIDGLDVASRIRFASAAAALKATRRGAQAGIPTREAVEAFLKQQS